VAKFAGTTNAAGEWLVPQTTTAEYRALPYGTAFAKNVFSNGWSESPHVVGTNGVLAIRVDFGGATRFVWLDVADANVRYWRGEQQLAIWDFEL